MPEITTEGPIETGRWVTYHGVMVRVTEHRIEGDVLQFKKSPVKNQKRAERRKLVGNSHGEEVESEA